MISPAHVGIVVVAVSDGALVSGRVVSMISGPIVDSVVNICSESFEVVVLAIVVVSSISIVVKDGLIDGL